MKVHLSSQSGIRIIRYDHVEPVLLANLGDLILTWHFIYDF